MKKYHIYALGAALVPVASFPFKERLILPYMQLQKQVKWVKSGEAVLPSGQNAKVILAAKDQRLYALNLKKLQGSANLFRCDLVYADGKTTRIMLRNDVQHGQENREIENPMPQPPLSKIIFWYESQKLDSTIEWWSKQSG